ncbi:uncharacterized protein LOC100200872 [Hydra vulgaris]|uniref:uncharacterized protein LOC100200872 n=1 Tax=Hydra vulgaris TaxID=6087 RepID=UPI0001925BC9|nr:uncharacterized protein LOC100200872 [Hydra vulgaris]
MSLISLEDEPIPILSSKSNAQYDVQDIIDKEPIKITDEDFDFLLGGLNNISKLEVEDSTKSFSKKMVDNTKFDDDQLSISDALNKANKKIKDLCEQRSNDCKKISTLMNQVSNHRQLISNLQNNISMLKNVNGITQNEISSGKLINKVADHFQRQLNTERAKRELLEMRLVKVESLLLGLSSGCTDVLQQSEISNDNCSSFSGSCGAISAESSSVSEPSKHKRRRPRRAPKNKEGRNDFSSKGSLGSLQNDMSYYSNDINAGNESSQILSQNHLSNPNQKRGKKENKPAVNSNQKNMHPRQNLKKKSSQHSTSDDGNSSYMDELMLLQDFQISSNSFGHAKEDKNLSEKEVAKSYFEKAQQYLSEQANFNNRIAGNIGLKLNDRVLGSIPIEWRIKKRDITKTEIIQHSGTFYTDNRGYRVQLKSQVDRLHGDIYFSVRILQGLFDENLDWPFQKKFCISVSDKMKSSNRESWIIPQNGIWIKALNKATVKKDSIVSEWKGPFNISQYLEARTIILNVSMSE